MQEDKLTTRSLCPQCLKEIPAFKVIDGKDVFIEKTCPQHGHFKTIIWRGEPSYDLWGMGEDAPGPQHNLIRSEKGCPHDCGLCTQHKARTCTVLMEVTNRCNLNCPVCFASAEKTGVFEPDLDEIRAMLEAVVDSGGPYPLQISGGEPTVRDDLADIISMAKKMGFPHVQVNTNALRLASEPDYLLELRDAGLDMVYMQFDGVSDDVYRCTRGADLVAVKEQALQNCVEAKIAVQLVPTLIPGVNTHQIGAIIQYAKQWIPVVKGVHFQPVSYFGRYPTAPADAQRITLPEVLQSLEDQTAREIKAANFLPRRRSDSHCGFSGFFILDEDDTLQPTTFFQPQEPSSSRCSDIQGRPDPSEHFRRFIQERSVYVEPSKVDTGSMNELDRFYQRSHSHYLSISGMPFQDAWTIDLDRLQGCCIHVISPVTRRLIPFCAYYLTSSSGQRLPGKGFLPGL